MSAIETVTGAAHGASAITMTSTFDTDTIDGAGAGTPNVTGATVLGAGTVAGAASTVSGVSTATTLGTATSTIQTWEAKGAALVNRAAHFVLALWTKVGNFGQAMEKDDPILAEGLKLIKAEAIERGIPVATITADAGVLLAQVQTVALQTDPAPGVPLNVVTLPGGGVSVAQPPVSVSGSVA
jgi:hypothetical protein